MSFDSKFGLGEILGFLTLLVAGVGAIVRINQKQALLDQRLGQLEKSGETVTLELKEIHEALGRIELAVVGNQSEVREQIKTIFDMLKQTKARIENR